jgi:hypothetical protein
VWVITNGGGLLRFDGTQWAQVDGTLRSLTRAACSTDTVYAVGLVGAFLVAEEQSRQIRAIDITIDDLFGVSTLPSGALMVGSRGSVHVLDSGTLQPYAQGIPDDLLAVVAFGLQSAWAVGDHGITYRLDQRGWAPIASGQELRAIAALTPANAVAVGDAGTVLSYVSGWLPAKSGVDVTLRDVIVSPGLWIVGDKGTVLTPGRSPSMPLRKVDIGTSCDLVAVFARNNSEVWVVGRGATGGGVC